jgi:6-phosphofructokinase 1
MNAAIRSVVRCAIGNKLEVIGIYRGYSGLIDKELTPLNHRFVSGIINRGGTVLKTARCPGFLTKEGQERAVQTLRENSIDGLIIIGGDGSFRGAHLLSASWGIPTIGIPATIDNDISGTDLSIGCDTAVNTALEAIDKIRDTATSLERIFVIEVMGRESGFIAIQLALAGGAEDVILPKKSFDINSMCHDIVEGNLRGKVSWIIIVAEGAAKAETIARQISEQTNLEVRVSVLGHIQRGGSPTATDRILALRLGQAAVNLLLEGLSGKAVGIIADEINVVDLEAASCPRQPKIDSLYRLVKILT